MPASKRLDEREKIMVRILSLVAAGYKRSPAPGLR
jgi:hypothetical protein